jgi:MFS superfamily sulfate permease-like transporter
LRLPAQPGAETAPGLVVYRFDAALFYANETRFADEVRALVEAAPHPVRWFVIEAGAITDLDYSAACSLRELCDDLTRRGVGLVFAQVSPFLRADMDRYGLTAIFGETHLVPTLHQALALVHSGLSEPRMAE